VAVQVGKLERLMVDEQQYAALGRQQCVEAGFCGAHGASFCWVDLDDAVLMRRFAIDRFSRQRLVGLSFPHA